MKLNNWMSEIDGKRDLLTLSIPGTHDCVTKFVQFEHISKTQDLTIAEQLNLGIRALDIRVESRGEALKMVHAFAKAFPTANKFGKQMDLDFVLNQCYDFLLENPSETIVFQFKNDSGKENEKCFDNLFFNYISKNLRCGFVKTEFPHLMKQGVKFILYAAVKWPTDRNSRRKTQGLISHAGLNRIRLFPNLCRSARAANPLPNS